MAFSEKVSLIDENIEIFAIRIDIDAENLTLLIFQDPVGDDKCTLSVSLAPSLVLEVVGLR